MSRTSIGVFTMGFGIMASVITNNVSALAALANGLLPLRRVKDSPLEHEQAHGLRIAPGEVAERDRLPLPSHPPLIVRRPEIPDTRGDDSHTPAASA